MALKSLEESFKGVTQIQFLDELQKSETSKILEDLQVLALTIR